MTSRQSPFPVPKPHNAPLASTAASTTAQHNIAERTTRELSKAENALCGAVAGLVSRAIVAPFDVVKITLQLDTNRRSYGILKSDGVIACAKRIIKAEGARGLFKGNLSAEYLYLTYGATQFLTYSMIDSALSKSKAVPKGAQSFIGGAAAGAMATCVTYPFDLLRTRFVAQTSTHKVYTSVIGAITKIHQQEGMRGFYRGLGPACIQIMPYMGVMFFSYDALSSAYTWLRYRIGPLTNSNSITSYYFQFFDTFQNGIVGAIAGIISKTTIYPLDLIRKRLQIQGPAEFHRYPSVPVYTGVTDAFVKIVRNEGPLALFRGLLPALAKAGPVSASMFFFFGLSRDFLLSISA